jgi:copper chaperone NosL
MKQFAAAILIVLIAAASPAWGADQKFVKPSPKDKCPVCGMFVAKYPDFIAQVIFRDGAVFHFDGVKDLMKFHFRLDRYSPGHKEADIAAIWVTDYYSLELIDGPQAWYVVGSDVYGPMGKELIPFSKESDARGFMKDHKGKSLLRFKDVSVELIRGLD